MSQKSLFLSSFTKLVNKNIYELFLGKALIISAVKGFVGGCLIVKLSQRKKKITKQ